MSDLSKELLRKYIVEQKFFNSNEVLLSMKVANSENGVSRIRTSEEQFFTSTPIK